MDELISWEELEMDLFLSKFLGQVGTGAGEKGARQLSSTSTITAPESEEKVEGEAQAEIDAQGLIADSTGDFGESESMDGDLRFLEHPAGEDASNQLDDVSGESFGPLDEESESMQQSLKRPHIVQTSDSSTYSKRTKSEESTRCMVLEEQIPPAFERPAMANIYCSGSLSDDEPQDLAYLQDSVGEEHWDGKEKKIKAREHARNTRKRRKHFITALEHQAKMLAGDFQLHSERRDQALRVIRDARDRMFHMCKRFLDLRFQVCEDVKEWGSCVEDDVTVCLPITPYRHNNSWEIKNGRRTLVGINSLISESASMLLLFKSVVKGSSKNPEHLRFSSTMREEDFITQDNLLMGSWNVRSTNAAACCGTPEFCCKGLISAKFSAELKINCVEIFFDVQKVHSDLQETFKQPLEEFPLSPNDVEVRSKTEYRVLTTAGSPCIIVKASDAFAEACGTSPDSLRGQPLPLPDELQKTSFDEVMQWRPVLVDLKNSLWAASNIRKPSVHLCDMHLLPMTSLSTEEFEQRSAHPTESTASTTNTESQRQQPDLLMWQFFSSPEDELREVVQYIYSFVKSMLSMFPEEVECILAPSKRQEQAGSENLVLQQVLRSAVELTSETNTLYRKDMFRFCATFWTLSKTVTLRFKQMEAVHSSEQHLLPLSRYSIAQHLKDSYAAAAENRMGIGGMQDDSYGGRTDMCNEAVAKDKYHDEHLGRASCASHPPDDFMGLEKLYRAFESFYVEMRTSGTLSKLFPLLSQVPNKSAARIFEEIIWACWSHHSNERIRELITLGRVHTDNRDFERATAIYTQILQIDPTFTDAYNRRATALYAKGEYLQCLRDINTVLSRERNHYGALCGRGLALMKMQQYSEARESFKKALAVNPWISKTPVAARGQDR